MSECSESAREQRIVLYKSNHHHHHHHHLHPNLMTSKHKVSALLVSEVEGVKNGENVLYLIIKVEMAKNVKDQKYLAF